MKSLRIDVWSDIACPWCYVGKRRLESALARFAHRDAVDVVWRSFELDQAAPREVDPSVSYIARLANKYRVPQAQAQAMIDRMVGVGKQDGLAFDFKQIRAGNTFDAHRIVHFAKESGKQDAMKERFFKAYFQEGASMGDKESLVRLAAEIGLDEEQVRAALASDSHAADVRGDEAEAREIGITGVPFFVLAERYAVSGAQPAEVLLGALEQAWREVANKASSPEAEGAVCGPEGCA